MSKEEVAQLVGEKLQEIHPGGVDITVAGNVTLRDGYWYVPVRPSAQPPSTFEYYDALADVETKLSLDKHLHIWLVPTMPEDEV